MPMMPEGNARVPVAEHLTPESPLSADASYDWIFVVPPEAKGWILDAICREIGGRVRGTWAVSYFSKGLLPPAKCYFFAHYWNYMVQLRRQPGIAEAAVLVWYTHPREISFTTQELVDGLSKTKRVIATCSLWRDLLISHGLAPERISVVLGAADPELFQTHRRTGSGSVGLSSAYYERKRPELLLELAMSMPQRNFMLIGRNWRSFPAFDELSALANFKYLETDYHQYPQLYREMDVFLSLSRLEGGPISLIEAMMCNAVPVASRTGFAPDIIRHGQNGFLFDPEAPAEHVVQLIEASFTLTTDVRSSVVQFSWKGLASEIIKISQG